MKTPKLQIRLNEEATIARDYLEECGYNVNKLVKLFLIKLYEEKTANRNLA